MIGIRVCGSSSGCDVPNESQLPLEEALNDQFRVDFYNGYIGNMGQAIADGGEKTHTPTDRPTPPSSCGHG